MSDKKKIVRIVMKDEDKEDILVNLVRNFMAVGATKEQAEACSNTGSVPMHLWISRWICHHTEYAETHEMTDAMFKKGLYAWIHYKATVEVLDKLELPEGEVEYP